MARYAYKEVCYYMLPPEYTENFEEKYGREFDHDANYDGDYWIVVGDYIQDLKDKIAQLEEDINVA